MPGKLFHVLPGCHMAVHHPAVPILYYAGRMVNRFTLRSSHKVGVQGAKPLAGGLGVSPKLLSPLCSLPQEASYE